MTVAKTTAWGSGLQGVSGCWWAWFNVKGTGTADDACMQDRFITNLSSSSLVVFTERVAERKKRIVCCFSSVMQAIKKKKMPQMWPMLTQWIIIQFINVAAWFPYRLCHPPPFAACSLLRGICVNCSPLMCCRVILVYLILWFVFRHFSRQDSWHIRKEMLKKEVKTTRIRHRERRWPWNQRRQISHYGIVAS